MPLDATVREGLATTYETLSRDGEITLPTKLPTYYEAFHQRFAPQVLASLDGEALLSALKLLSNKDSLAYWLEFKNDQQFAAIFGSVAGGSALKYGVYWRNEANSWMAGNPLHQHVISVADAVSIARRDRDQLLAGAELIAALPRNGADADYEQLQMDLNKAAPDVRETAWGHKYFCLIFPDKISDVHVVWHQQLQLIRLLQIPPKPLGRYTCEGRYVAIAAELDLPLHTALSVIYRRNGAPRAYWRIDIAQGMFDIGETWELMRDQSCLAFGMPELEDLSNALTGQDAKAQVAQRIQAQYGSSSGSRVQQVMNFGKAIDAGDCALVVNGEQVLGIGTVVGPYTFVAGSAFPHRHAIEWQSLESWSLPKPKSSKYAVDTIDYRQDAASLVQIERHLLNPLPHCKEKRCPIPALTGVPARIQAALERKGQVILYGPPGTGKTYWALNAARELAARSHFSSSFAKLSDDQRAVLLGGATASSPAIRLCTFHPGYGYEDFIEGYRPTSKDGQMIFERRDGIFKQLCADATKQPARHFYLIVDEINRGDVPRIFGELLTLLEWDKRGMSLLLPMSGDRFSVPPNVYVIGTMNTADRSIALLDTALRRRFSFIELMPDMKVLGNAVIDGIPLGPWLAALNQRVRDHIGRDARNLQIGHAYLLAGDRPVTTFSAFARVLHDDIVPLLQEYCYESYPVLAQILGAGLVDTEQQRLREELFDPDQRDDLIQALLAPSPDIVASPEALQADTDAAVQEATADAAESEP